MTEDRHDETPRETRSETRSERRSEADAILRDSIEYGVEYGLEDGLEAGIGEGLRKGIREGAASATVNAAEEAAGDCLADKLDAPGTTQAKPWWRKRLVPIVKLVIVVLVLGWIGVRLTEAWTEIKRYDWTLHYDWIAASCVFYLAAFFPASVVWYLSLRWMGQEPTFFGAVRAFYASQLGKYLPGKAMVVVIRSGMVASEKVKLSVAAVCVFYETLTMMATGAFLSALVICICFREHWVYSLMALGTMLLAGLPVLPPFFIRIVRILGIGRKDPTLAEHMKRITWRSVLVGFALMTVLWILFGVGLWAAIRGLGVTPGNFIDNMPRYVSVTALAIVLGFAVPVAPGGIGIREAVLSILLIPYFEVILAMPENGAIHVQAENLALIVSLEQRIISIVAELSLVALFFLGPALSDAVRRLRRCVRRRSS